MSISGIGSVSLAGTHSVSPTTTTTYVLTATNPAGSVTAEATVTVGSGSSGGGGGQGPVITIAGGNTIDTIYRNVTLDASSSSSPSNNTPLTYVWQSVNNTALIFNANAPVTRVTLGTTPGPYLFNVTVIDSKGNSSSTIVTVILIVN